MLLRACRTQQSDHDVFPQGFYKAFVRLLWSSYKAVGRVSKEFYKAFARGLEGFWKVSRELASLSRRRTSRVLPTPRNQFIA